jgi:hypothetical protein
MRRIGKVIGVGLLKGFFKQYELFYVMADERDVIRLRTTFRQPQEDMYLYRTRVPPAQAAGDAPDFPSASALACPCPPQPADEPVEWYASQPPLVGRREE